MNKWIKRGKAESLGEYVIEKTGMEIDDLKHYVKTKPEQIGGLCDAYEIIMKNVLTNRHITIVGDYDADGVMASAILWMLLCKIGVKKERITVRIPKRFSEGYGISEKIIDEIEAGLIICIDNGITAKDALKKAKDKGVEIVIMDHHIGNEDDIPNANAIVDQHVESCYKNTRETPAVMPFVDFCGAGLAYKLAEMVYSKNKLWTGPDAEEKTEIELDKMAALAAIATVADSVTLFRDNRYIVQRGLRAINESVKSAPDERRVTYGLYSLLSELKIKEYKESDIAFKLAPIINACGRMIDDGARIPCAAMCQDTKEIKNIAQKLIAINDKRKQDTADAIDKARKSLREIKAPIIIKCDPDISQGVVGIIAGQLADEYKIPAIVLTENENGLLVGSARAGREDINLKELMDSAAGVMDKFGGHAGAAGLSIRKENLEKFTEILRNEMSWIHVGEQNNVVEYDLEISVNEISKYVEELKELAPFGAGIPAPVFKISDVELDGIAGRYGRIMGAQKQHIKFAPARKSYQGLKVEIVAFGTAQQYMDMRDDVGMPPRRLSFVGEMEEKNDSFGHSYQILAKDFDM